MPVLQPSEYDISYFDGNKGSYSHNAGYTKYRRWRRKSAGIVPFDESTGSFFGDIAKRFDIEAFIDGKDVLELGCAYGFLVEDMRALGANAYGLDVSQYAYDQADPSIQPYLTVADARTYLTNYSRNQWDVIVSRWFLDCIDDNDLPDLIDEMNRISKNQAHVIGTLIPDTYYNVKDPQVWVDSFDWDRGTIIVPDTFNQIYRK